MLHRAVFHLENLKLKYKKTGRRFRGVMMSRNKRFRLEKYEKQSPKQL